VQWKEIARTVDKGLEKVMTAYGYLIALTLTVDIGQHGHVLKTIYEINVAPRLRVVTNEEESCIRGQFPNFCLEDKAVKERAVLTG